MLLFRIDKNLLLQEHIVISMRRVFFQGRPLRRASSLVGTFDKIVNESPMREAMRYTDKNMKWTASEFKVHPIIRVKYSYEFIILSEIR